MITADRINAAIDDLGAGRLPDRGEVETLVEALRRMRAGVSYTDAIGETGSIQKAERNSAIVEIGERFGCGAWEAAELVRRQLKRPPTTDAARAALRLGGGDLKRNALYLILSEAFKDRAGQTPGIVQKPETDR